MNEYLMVDGYNIIYAWALLEDKNIKNMEHARDRLVEVLANYSARSGMMVFVVFDAHQVKGGDEHVEVKNDVRIIYTREGETADAAIEKMVSKMTGLGRVYVVTSDYDEQRVIFGSGAYRLTPGDLSQQIEYYRTKEEKMIKKKTVQNDYLENRLEDSLRRVLEEWRKSKN